MTFYKAYKILVEDTLEKLQKYIHDAGMAFLNNDEIEELLTDYPLDQNTLVYRGLHFDSKEDFTKFISTIKNNKIVFKGYSSWSPDRLTGMSFALTKPTNDIRLLGKDFFSAREERIRKKDYLAGYGVVLSTVAHANQAIDVSDTGLGQESEIIIPAGSFTVKVDKILRPHEDTAKEVDINQYIQAQRGLNPQDEKLEYSLMQYILQNYESHLTDKSKRHLFLMFAGTLNNLKVGFKTSGKPRYSNNIVNQGHDSDLYDENPEANIYAKDRYVTGKPEIQIKFFIENLNNNLIYYMPLFLESDRKRVKDKITKVIFDLAQKTIKLREKYQKKYDIFFEGDIKHVYMYLDKHAQEMLSKALNYTAASMYSNLNSQNYLDKINSILDPQKKRDAIKQYTDNITKLLQKIS